jgi:hypothetical protein
MKKNTRVKIAGIPENIWTSCYNGMTGITLNARTHPRVAINGVVENQHCFSEGRLTPVEPSISTLCVDDVIVDTDGDETRVLAMQGDSFLRSHVGNLDHAGDWYTKDQASLFGWEVKEDNLIRWKKWDTGETGTWDDDKEEIAYFGSGWTYPPHPFETGTKEPGETGTEDTIPLPDSLGYNDIEIWYNSYRNGPPLSEIMDLVEHEVKKERKWIVEEVKAMKETVRKNSGTYKYDDCYDDVLELLEYIEDNQN